MLLEVHALSPKKIIFEGNAPNVILPGESGVFEVLPFHRPILSRLVSGIMVIGNKGFAIKRGVVKVNKNKVVIMAEET